MEVVSLCARAIACMRMHAYFISVFECAMSRLRIHMHVSVADVSVCMRRCLWIIYLHARARHSVHVHACVFIYVCGHVMLGMRMHVQSEYGW